MTCIVGVSKEGTVWLGGDRAATDGNLNRTIIGDPKVFMRGELGIGVCGSPKVMDAVAHAIELPVQRSGTARGFLVGELVPAMRAGLKALDCTADEQGHGTCFRGAMLLAYRGEVYTLEMNFQLVKGSRGYASVGSGSDLALGSLAETWRFDSPRKRILASLKAAADGNAGVAPPFDIVVVGKERPGHR